MIFKFCLKAITAQLSKTSQNQIQTVARITSPLKVQIRISPQLKKANLMMGSKSNAIPLEERIAHLKTRISNYPDFPKPGILFRDMFSLLRDPEAFKELRDVMVEFVQKYIPETEVIVGLESRGFLFGSILAIELGLPFVPIRKPGKLPGELKRVTYQLEYGTDTFEIQKDSIQPGQNILIVDDLIATGGSLNAACKLIEDCKGNVAGSLVIMELVDLKGRDKVNYPVHVIMTF